MHFRQLDLNLLVALDALLVERSITGAGRRLHLTQSAMSGALARLREYFGDEILVQVGRRMMPTPLAESLAVPVREILLKVKATIDIEPGFHAATSKRRFSLMMSDYAATMLMPEVLRRVEPVAPHVQFEIIDNDSGDPFETLDRADIDLLIMPHELMRDDHPRSALYEDSYLCVVWNENRKVGTALTAEQYLDLGHVIVQFNRGRMQAVDEWFLSRHGITRRIEVIAMNFNSIPQCIVGTQRIATMQRRLAEYYAKYLPLKLLAVPYELPVLAESMQWHRFFDEDPGNQWLRDVLRAAAQTASK